MIEYDWEATLDAAGKPTGLCIPVDIAKFTHVCAQLTRSFEPGLAD